MEKEEYKSVQVSSVEVVLTPKQAEQLKQVLDNVNTIASLPQPANMILGCPIEREIRLVREIRELRRKNNNLIAIVWVISAILIALSIWLLLQ